QQAHTAEHRRIGGADLEEQTSEAPGEHRGGDETDDHADRDETERLAEDEGEHIARPRAERDAYPDLLRAPAHRIRDQAEESEPRHHHRDDREDPDQDGEELPPGLTRRDGSGHG